MPAVSISFIGIQQQSGFFGSCDSANIAYQGIIGLAYSALAQGAVAPAAVPPALR
jgi:hypothetical protein